MQTTGWKMNLRRKGREDFGNDDGEDERDMDLGIEKDQVRA